MLLAELGDSPDRDRIVKLDYDGSIGRSDGGKEDTIGLLAGSEEAERLMARFLDDHEYSPDLSLEKAVSLAAQAWAMGMAIAETNEESEPEEEEISKIDAARVLKDHLKTWHVEAAVLERDLPSANKFRLLEDKELRGALKDV